MEAIEFFAKVKDGVIEIPKEYLVTLQDEFRVIILVEPRATGIKKKKKQASLKVKTKGLVSKRNVALS